MRKSIAYAFGRRALALGMALCLGSVPGLRAQNPAEVEDHDTSPYHQALLAYKSGDFAAARTAIDAAEQAKPDDLPTEILKARILTEQHDFAAGEKLLRHYLTASGPFEVQLALGDLLLRKRAFTRAADTYTAALANKPGDPDLTLKLIYADVSIADLVTAGKYASGLKPLDPVNPAYYFARAALAQATNKSQDADQDIETVRTIYGITVANRYLKTYLQVFSPAANTVSAALTVPTGTTNAAPAHP